MAIFFFFHDHICDCCVMRIEDTKESNSSNNNSLAYIIYYLCARRAAKSCGSPSTRWGCEKDKRSRGKIAGQIRNGNSKTSFHVYLPNDLERRKSSQIVYCK